MAGDLGEQVDQGSPPSSLLPPKSLWDLALQGSGASSPFGLHERGRGAEWEEESGLSQGGDLGWGVADTGKWVFALFFFFFSFKIKMKRKALRQISGLCCCPGHMGGVHPLFCGSGGPVQSAYMTLGRKLKKDLRGEACCAHAAPPPPLTPLPPLRLLPLPPPPALRKLWDHSDLGTGTQAHTLNL